MVGHFIPKCERVEVKPLVCFGFLKNTILNTILKPKIKIEPLDFTIIWCASLTRVFVGVIGHAAFVYLAMLR